MKPMTPINTESSNYHYNTPMNLTRSRSIMQESQKCPPCITVGLRPQMEVFESNPQEFKVIYLGVPFPTVSWKKNDVALQENTAIIIKSKANSSILCIDAVQAEDCGLYSCTVENSQGKVETRCQLTVLPKRPKNLMMTNTEDSTAAATSLKPCPPKIIDHLKSRPASDGEEIELSCKIVCPYHFDVVWIHNGKEIKPSNDFQYHHVDNHYTLKIPELFPEDSGIYTCEAFNDYGETFTTCSLFVSCPGKTKASPPPAVFKTFPKSVSVTRGAPVVVQAELHPGCDRQVTWFKDGSLVAETFINDQNKAQFSIVEAGLKDNGLYEMHVTSSQGSEKHVAAFAIVVFL